MDFDAALIEVELEDACESLGLDDGDRRYVMLGHRANDGSLLRLCLARNCDVAGYAQCLLSIREGLDGH